MTEGDDTRTPWGRAGYSHPDWHKCLSRATDRYVAAANARSAFFGTLRTIRPDTLKEIARLRTAHEDAHRDWLAVIAGDSLVVDRLHDELAQEEQK